MESVVKTTEFKKEAIKKFAEILDKHTDEYCEVEGVRWAIVTVMPWLIEQRLILDENALRDGEIMKRAIKEWCDKNPSDSKLIGKFEDVFKVAFQAMIISNQYLDGITTINAMVEDLYEI